MSDGIDIDSKQWQTAVNEYAVACNKTYAEAMNRQLNNVAVQSLKYVRDAEKATIRGLTGKEWWPKLIAKLLVARGEKRSVETKSDKWGMALRKELKRQSNITRAYSRAQARTFSRKEINRRTSATKFLRGFFLSWSNTIAAMVPGVKGPRGLSSGARFFKYIKTHFQPATEHNPTCVIATRYDYKKRGDKTASGAENLLYQYADKGLAAATADMIQFTEKKLADISRRFSAA